MPNFSLRGIKMPESPIRKLAPYADEAKRKGLKVYHLNIGQPDINSPEVSIEALKKIEAKFFPYTASEGLREYRETLAKYYTNLGISGLNLENFIITSGGSEALSITMNTLCDPDDEIIVLEPYYANYYGFAETLNIKIVPVISTLENEFSLPKTNEFKKCINQKTRAILITNPNNPTGYLYSKEELRKLADIVKENNLFLISDEVYREYVYDGKPHYSILNFSDLAENSIVIDSESKRYNMCGLRCGSIVSRNQDFLKIVLKFAQARLSPPLISQLIAQSAYSAPSSYIEQVKQEYKERRDLLVKLLKEIPGVKCPVPKGAFYCTVELPVDNAEDFCLWLLSNFEYNGATVMLAPAAGFYQNKELGKKQVRLAYVINKDEIMKAVKILSEGIKKYIYINE